MAYVPHTGGDAARQLLDAHEDALVDMVHDENPPDTYLRMRGMKHYGTKKPLMPVRQRFPNKAAMEAQIDGWIFRGHPHFRIGEGTPQGREVHWDQAAKQRVLDDIEARRLDEGHFRERAKLHVGGLRALSAVTPGRKDPADEDPGHVDVRDEVFPQEAGTAAKRLRLDEGGGGARHPRSTALARRGVHSQKVFY